MASYKIQHTQFDPSLIPKVDLVEKKSKPTPKEPNGVSYRESPFEYTYTEVLSDGKTVQRIAEFIVEGPPMKCLRGIQIRSNANGGDEASIFVTVDLSKPEVASFAGPHADSFCSKLELWAKQMLLEQWGKAFPGKQRPTSIEGLDAFFAPIFYRKIDQTTGMVTEGKNPTKWFKLVYYGKPSDRNFRCTPFTLPTADAKTIPEVVPWEILQHADFDFIPAIKIRRNYVGLTAQIQMEIVSGVILSLTPTGEMVVQRDTAVRLGADMSLIERLHAQIAAIRKDTIEKKEEASTEPAAKPTLSEPAVQPSLAPPTTTITTGHIPTPSASALLSSAPLALPTVTTALPVPSGVSGLPVPQFAGLPIPTPTN